MSALVDLMMNLFACLQIFFSSIISSGHPPSLCHGPFYCLRRNTYRDVTDVIQMSNIVLNINIFYFCIYSQFLSMLDTVQQHDDL